MQQVTGINYSLVGLMMKKNMYLCKVMRALRTEIEVELIPIYAPSEARNIAEALLMHILQLDRTHLLIYHGSPSPEQLADLKQATKRLAQGEPLQHIMGYTEFHGARFKVTGDVLIPRPETEELVEWILRVYDDSPRRVLDIGTGSGCIAISLAKARPHWQVHAIDISPAALDIAANNARWNGANVSFHQADILTLQDAETYDIIVSNPPYIAPSEQADMHINVLQYEPHLALFAPEDDPLLFYRHIVLYAQHHLAASGGLFLEINQRLGKDTCTMIESNTHLKTMLKKDMQGNDRMVFGCFENAK